jgi:hypothetical protein
VPRAIVDLPTDDPADIILVGGLAANAAKILPLFSAKAQTQDQGMVCAR